MNDIDRLDSLLEHRADLLASSAGLLQGVIRLGRAFTDSEEDSWNWAMGHIDKLAADAQELTGSLRRRGYDLTGRPGPWDHPDHELWPPRWTAITRP